MTIHLSILLFFPLALGALGALAPRGLAPATTLVGALVALAYAVLLLIDFVSEHARVPQLKVLEDVAICIQLCR